LKEFNTLREISESDTSQTIYNEIKFLMEGIAKETVELVENEDVTHLAMDIEFMETLGGNIFILETIEDLKQIPVNDTSLLEHAAIFDVAFLLQDLRHMLLVTITSDTGGATYFIPDFVFTSHPATLMSLSLTHHKSTVSTFIKPETAGQ